MSKYREFWIDDDQAVDENPKDWMSIEEYEQRKNDYIHVIEKQAADDLVRGLEQIAYGNLPDLVTPALLAEQILNKYREKE